MDAFHTNFMAVKVASPECGINLESLSQFLVNSVL